MYDKTRTELEQMLKSARINELSLDDYKKIMSSYLNEVNNLIISITLDEKNRGSYDNIRLSILSCDIQELVYLMNNNQTKHKEF